MVPEANATQHHCDVKDKEQGEDAHLLSKDCIFPNYAFLPRPKKRHPVRVEDNGVWADGIPICNHQISPRLGHNQHCAKPMTFFKKYETSTDLHRSGGISDVWPPARNKTQPLHAFASTSMPRDSIACTYCRRRMYCTGWATKLPRFVRLHFEHTKC